MSATAAALIVMRDAGTRNLETTVAARYSWCSWWRLGSVDLYCERKAGLHSQPQGTKTARVIVVWRSAHSA